MLTALAFVGPGGAAASPEPDQPARNAPPTREKTLGDLLALLRQAPDAEAAARIRTAIDRLWSRSGSPTADLLMSRAETLLKSGQQDVAVRLLDRIVMLYPKWSFAWRRHAQAAMLQGDQENAVIALDHALAVEPRDFIAIDQLARILGASGKKAAALELMRRELALDPQNADVRRDAEKLQREIEGERI